MNKQFSIMKIKTTTLTIFFIISTYLGFAQTPDANGILYVKKGSIGNGNTWSNAIGELADALKAAKSNPAIQQIWVASGTYRPLYTPEDGQNFNANPIDPRDKAFLLVDNVKVYGGFAGIETTTSQRNIAGNTSMLNGDIGTLNSNTDNAYHVVVSSGNIGIATFDGFTILNGNANGSTAININGTLVNRGFGGGMLNISSSPSINNCTFWGNRATNGGGMYNSSSSSSINNSTFSNNIATNGAGIHNASSSPTIGFSRFLSNNAQSGGGMFNGSSSSPAINNSLFSGNNASNLGGGMYNTNSSATINSSTFSANSAPNSNGQAIHTTSSSTVEIQINNSIIWKDAGFAGNDNLKESLGKYVLSNCILQYPGAGYNINGSYQNLNPKFTNAKGTDNTFGTDDDDLTLTSISPAIGAGDNSLYIGNIHTDKDLNGSLRLIGSVIDIGAYESSYHFATMPDANGVVYVKKGSTGNGSSWSNALGELADALRAAKTSTGIQQIWVANGIYKPLYHASDLSGPSTTEKNNAFVMVNNVQLYGGFNGTETAIDQRPIFNALGGRAEGTVLSGDFNGDDTFNTAGRVSGGNTENAYHVVISSGNVGSAVLDGFTITGGYAYGSNNDVITVNGRTISKASGAGIYHETSSPKLNNLNIIGNAASSIDYMRAAGAGIYCFTSSPIISNVNISSNKAGSGGGLHIHGGGIPQLMNVMITNNQISNPHPGGAIYCSMASAVLVNVTISDNTGTHAVYSYDSPLAINNSIIKNGIRAEVGALPTYKNSLIEGSGGSAAWNTAYGTNGGNNIDVDPLFVNPSGGNYRLQATSPAINGASNTLYTNAGGNLATDKDLAGNSRLNNTNMDIGAFEYLSTPAITPTNGIIYVNQNVTVTSNKTGDSWANALPQLADALVAASTNTAIQQIWVANGVYKPLYSPEDGINFGKADGRNNAFRLVSNVKIYGGFTGTETSINDRNPQQRSVLSGDIDNNDITVDNLSTVINGDNTYHVTIASGALGTAVLDGFIITGGDANGPSNITVGVVIWRDSGAGLYSANTSSKFNNVTLFGNKARYGGGVYYWNSAPRLSLFNLIYNTATAEGGGMYASGGSTPKTLSGLIIKNTAPIGGGMLCLNASPTFVNATITDNYASSYGGAMYTWSQSSSSPKFYNCIISGNKKTTNNLPSNIERDINNSTPIVQNSLVQGSGGSTAWIAATGIDGGNNIDANPVFTDIANNDYTLQNNSPAINAGNNLLYTNEGGNLLSDTDLAGNPRLREANIDLGAFETAGTLPVTLLSFQIKKDNNAAVLTWETASEKDNAGFEILRKTNDQNFVSIATVVGKGTTDAKNSYTWYDRKPLNGNNYYKLIQKDKDGKIEELGIRTLNFSLNHEDILLYPNPVIEKANVLFATGRYKNITLSDISGKILQSIALNPTETEKVIIMDKLPKGIYLLRFTGNERSAVLKMIKN